MEDLLIGQYKLAVRSLIKYIEALKRGIIVLDIKIVFKLILDRLSEKGSLSKINKVLMFRFMKSIKFKIL
ncbi:hypothetical protein GCM10022396_15230 [Flavivirga amylovorans]